ncbi:MAG: hypothetical protein HUU14_09215 [Dehalococcoidia bacterium]|nr:hypothetical protein [Chloroflexi bacterium CFX7]MCK6563535.1 hypothetical protein [Dehalococcoidia bacterium]NUQ56049.1 hypothetical protein [Dehalococcoidia bacterium]
MDGPGAAQRVFVSYIDKSREYYLAQGFGNPYRWAHHRDAPFARLPRPLASCRIGLVTTAMPLEGREGVPSTEAPKKTAYAAALDPAPERLFTQDLAWDKEATNTDDLGSYFPVHALQECAASGRIGSLSRRFYGIPTSYSQRQTIDLDAPAVLSWCREDGVDAVLLAGL